MSPERPTIFIIDDDDSVRRALGRVMTQGGLAWKTYDSAESFLAAVPPDASGCIVADMTMPGINGLELKKQLNAAPHPLPLVFLTAHDTEETRAAARDAGAAAYFRKPVDIQALLDAIRWALQQPAP